MQGQNTPSALNGTGDTQDRVDMGPPRCPHGLATLASFTFAVLTAVAGLAGCRSNQGAEPGSIARPLVVTGSSTIAPLAAELGKAFEALHPGTRIDVQSGGSSRGIADVQQGTADIGMVSRSLTAKEAHLRGHVVARDGIALIVHATNPLRGLTSTQVRDAYLGKVTSWAALGGAQAPITIVNKAEGRSTLELFLQHFKLSNDAIRAQVIAGENQQAIKTVAGNPTALAYVSIGTAEADMAAGVPIKMLELDGGIPSMAAVSAGRFALSRELNFVTKSEPEGVSSEFIRFATSVEAHPIISQQRFVPMGQ